MIVELTSQNIAEIIELEQSAFSTGMQASEATYLRRFKLGHVVLGYYRDRLDGIISFSYGAFNPLNASSLPNNFADWSTQEVPKAFDTVFLYNLGLSPSIRGRGVIRQLVYGAFRRAIVDGCHKVVAEGPIPSYAGNHHLQCNQEIREALDLFAADGSMPMEEILFKDPHLALYRKLCFCSIVKLFPDFLPADKSSGGFRAMLYRNLNDFHF